MSTALSEPVAGWDVVRNALGEIRACNADFEGFFDDVYDRLGSMSSDLADRRKQWLGQREQARAEQEQTRIEQERIRAEQEQVRAEQEQTRIEQERVRAELDQHATGDTQREQHLQQQCQHMERQHRQLQQERAELETELEAVRNRAADMTESLAEKKRLAEQQHSQWTGEFQRMRLLLEGISRTLVERELAAANGSPRPNNRGDATRDADARDDDLVLDSVRAQFDMLQRDLTRRRSVGS